MAGKKSSLGRANYGNKARSYSSPNKVQSGTRQFPTDTEMRNYTPSGGKKRKKPGQHWVRRKTKNGVVVYKRGSGSTKLHLKRDKELGYAVGREYIDGNGKVHLKPSDWD